MDKGLITQRDSVTGGGNADADLQPVPGLILIFSAGRATCVALPIPRAGLDLGRGELPPPLPPDPKMSRRHASVRYDGERFWIRDHGSQNGTFIDGARVTGEHSGATLRLLRTGDSLFLFSADIRAARRLGVRVDAGLVLGPTMQDLMAQVGRAAHYGHTLHITGESGSGKEGVARAFHNASSNRAGPFVAINCATIASGVAERLLFGARRGAYSGAVVDTEGLIQSADGGTLFLDEIAELDPTVQSKLLRVIETREVLQLGALKPRPVNMQLCSASHRNLRGELVAGRFREDLYFRISRPEIEVPPLRARPVEIPWLVERLLASVDPTLIAHSTFVEACLSRHWPGNVRELHGEVRAAAQQILGLGSHKLEASHLSPTAGLAIEPPAEVPIVCGALRIPHPVVGLPRAAPRAPLERAQVEDALSRAGGNISAAARLLGLHRTQLKRLLEKYGLAAGRSDPSLEEEGD